jgi:hypothetical protein
VRCCGGQEGRINFKMEIKSYIALVIGAGIWIQMVELYGFRSLFCCVIFATHTKNDT